MQYYGFDIEILKINDEWLLNYSNLTRSGITGGLKLISGITIS